MVSHQRWIWGFHCVQVTKHASDGIHPGFETQGRRHHNSKKTAVSVARQKGLMSSKYCFTKTESVHVFPSYWPCSYSATTVTLGWASGTAMSTTMGRTVASRVCGSPGHPCRLGSMSPANTTNQSCQTFRFKFIICEKALHQNPGCHFGVGSK